MPPEHHEKWDDAYARAHAIYGHKLQAAIDTEDIDGAHRYWCYFAEACIEMAKGRTDAETVNLLENSPPRGGPPKLKRRMRRKPTDHRAHPTTHLQRYMTNTINKLRELINRLKTQAEDDTDAQAWNKIQDQEILATIVKLWIESQSRVLCVLGSEAVGGLVKGDFPSVEELQRINIALRKT